MKLKILVIVLFLICYLPLTPTKSDAFIVHAIVNANDGTTYDIIWAPPGNPVSITQLGSNIYGLTGFGDSSNNFVTDYIISPSTGNVAPNFQSAIIPAIPFASSIARFDPTGSGTVRFDNGTNLTMADLMGSLFNGQLTTQAPNPGTLFPSNFDPNVDYPIYGFNLPPGGHPTSHIPFLDPAPSDGILLLGNQSIVFAWSPHPNYPLAIGVAGFDLDKNLRAFGGGASIGTIGASPSSNPVPEPSSFLLFSSGLFGAIGKLRRKLFI